MCNHSWAIVDKEVLPSAFEQAVEFGEVMESDNIAYTFRKKYICILECIHCGKLDKTVEINP